MHPYRLIRFSLFLAVLSISLDPCLAIDVPSVFGDNMVFQQGQPLVVWGTAEPGEAVSVRIGRRNSAAAQADEQGKWKVELKAMKASGPHEFQIVGSSKALTFENILIGEVWVCSGQSNMQWSVKRSDDSEKEIAAASFPRIRLFSVPRVSTGVPQADVDASWEVCSPETIEEFSAVGYFFGRVLSEKMGTPIGLINTSWGGTRIEPWTPLDSLRADPELELLAEEAETLHREYRSGIATAVAKHAEWLPVAQAAVSGGKEVPLPPAWPAMGNRTPAALYYGMVHPLVPFAIRGAIWYQGESNLRDGLLYHNKMNALIRGWRKVWAQPDLPFYFVQLASFRYDEKKPTELPLLWEAQTATLKTPHTGMAVTSDISDVDDIHPTNKQDVGKRLALWALAKTYGYDQIVYSGPLFKSMTVEGAKARVSFDHLGGGLASRDGKPLTHFTIAGDDQKFHPAEATIDGGNIVVSSSQVAKPVAVRFAWHNKAEPNLMNKDGLPAPAFRTDNW